jgi:hypothetical protein
MNWTIQSSGAEKLIADWGFSRLKRKLVSQGVDEFSFSADGANADSPALFTPFESIVTVWRDRAQNSDGTFSGGVIWFVGLVTQIPRAGSPENEGNAYKLVGPAWYLQARVFEKTFNVFTGFTTPTDPRTDPIYVQQTFSHCFLNLTNNSLNTPYGRLTTGGQIIEALDWALKPFTDVSAAPPFQKGSITPDLSIPFDEVRDITCEEVVRKMIRWTPDAVVRFDYTTTPPTYHCTRRADQRTVNIDITNGNLVKSFQVNPRYDLQSKYVMIRYEKTTTVDGISSFFPFTFQWPLVLPTNPLDHYNALRITVDLQGLSATNQTAVLVCDLAKPFDPAWWLARHDGFDAYNPGTPPNASDALQIPDPNNPIAKVTIIADTVTRTPTNDGEQDNGWVNELSAGALAPWMTNFHSQRITFSCRADIQYRNGSVIQGHTLVYQCLTTNANSGTYRNGTVQAYDEPIPLGIEKAIYDAVSVLQYEGELVLQEEEVSGMVQVGDLLNFTGGELSEWETMQAQVQQVREDLDTGTTTIHFGPPAILSAGELVDLLRVNRNRLIKYAPSMQVSGSAGGSSEVSMGSNTPEKNSSTAAGRPNPQVIGPNIDGTGPVVTHSSDPVEGPKTVYIYQQVGSTPPPIAGSIIIKLLDAAGNHLKIQPITACQNGVSGKLWGLFSDFIPDP